MKASAYIKGLIVAMVAVTSFWDSSALLATPPQKGKKIKVNDISGERLPIAAFATNAMSVSPDRNNVAINLSVNVHDTRPNMKYMWRLRVMEKTTKQDVVKRFYPDDIVRLLDGPDAQPIFNENIELLSGQYKIIVDLFATPEDFDLTSRNLRARSPGQTSLSFVSASQSPLGTFRQYVRM